MLQLKRRLKTEDEKMEAKESFVFGGEADAGEVEVLLGAAVSVVRGWQGLFGTCLRTLPPLPEQP
jgi:hypothetical protein